MAIAVTVEETGAVAITTSNVVGNSANVVSFDPTGIDTVTATNIQDALHQIADQQIGRASCRERV